MPEKGWAGTADEVANFLGSRCWKLYLKKARKDNGGADCAKQQVAFMILHFHVLRFIDSKSSSFVLHGNIVCDDLPTKFLGEEERIDIQKALQLFQKLKADVTMRGPDGAEKWLKDIVGEKKLQHNALARMPSFRKHRGGTLESSSARLEQCLARKPGFDIDGLPSPDAMQLEMVNFCIENALVVFCTVSSTATKQVRQGGPFDLVVVDEAAQLVEAEVISALQLAGIRRMVLVGDPNQLPATVFSKVSICNEAMVMPF